MRLRIALSDDLVDQLDSRVGHWRCSAFISAAIRKALDGDRRWGDIEAGFGALADRGHEWDADPSAWVQAQRHDDLSRVG